MSAGNELVSHPELPVPIAVTNLLFRYAELIDAGDLEGIGQLLAHCVVKADSGTWSGAAEITKMYDDFTRKHDDGTPRSKHVITNPIVERYSRREMIVEFVGDVSQHLNMSLTR